MGSNKKMKEIWKKYFKKQGYDGVPHANLDILTYLPKKGKGERCIGVTLDKDATLFSVQYL